jgi:hypothetical protein
MADHQYFYCIGVFTLMGCQYMSCAVKRTAIQPFYFKTNGLKLLACQRAYFFYTFNIKRTAINIYGLLYFFKCLGNVSIDLFYYFTLIFIKRRMACKRQGTRKGKNKCMAKF